MDIIPHTSRKTTLKETAADFGCGPFDQLDV